jgi:hypothetical protein
MHLSPGQIRTKADLLRIALAIAPSRACARAIQGGEAEVLGGFSSIPPYDLPGWIVRVTSRHGRTWILCMLADETQHRVVGREADEVPWENWVGHANRSWSPYDGDRPHDWAVEHLGAIGLGARRVGVRDRGSRSDPGEE